MFRYQASSRSNSVAVPCSLSNIWNTCHSDISLQWLLATACLLFLA